MRGAPPVQMACGREARAAVAVGLLSATAAAAFFGWLGWHAQWPSGLIVATMAAAALLAGAAGGWRVKRAGERRLAWDGRTWALDGIAGEVGVMVDVGSWLLVRHRSVDAVVWLPLRLRSCGASVHLARAALQAHAGRASAGARLDVNG